MNNPQEILNLKEVAELLGMSERTIYNWAQTKYIPSFKLGKSWRFNKSEITQWINSNRDTESNIPPYQRTSDYDPIDENNSTFNDSIEAHLDGLPSDPGKDEDFSPLDVPPFFRKYKRAKADNDMKKDHWASIEKYSSKETYINAYGKWGKKDDIELKRLYLKEKLSTKEIAEHFNRSEQSIRSRLKMNFVYLRDEYYPARPNLYKDKPKCPKCESEVTVETMEYDGSIPSREYYNCINEGNPSLCWSEWVDEFKTADENKYTINDEETKINLFTNHIEIEMSKRPDNVLNFEIFEQDYSQDTINEGLKRLEPFGYKLQETQVTKHKFITRG